MTTRLETDANTASQRNTVLFRTYWDRGSLLFLAQVFFTPDADIPDNLSFDLDGSNITAEHPQGIKAAWWELKDTDNIVGFCNEHANGHPTCTSAHAWFEAMYYSNDINYGKYNK